MNRIRTLKRFFGNSGAYLAIVVGAVLLAFTNLALGQYEDYRGPEWCADCHENNYNKWKTSGHPYKLMKAEEAQYRPIPLPNGYRWDDISYVIGGYKWKSRYMDDQGYIITTSLDEDGRPVDGRNQYNYLTGEWSNYHAGEVDLPYNCGSCHTTGWIADEDAATDGDLSDNQDGLPGIHGTFYAGGVQCEECHGPGMEMSVNDSAEFCGSCHYRGSTDTIPASGGFIQHHEQYNEFLAGPHSDALDCTSCHDPHLRGEFSIKEDAQCGVSCHKGIGDAFAMTTMADYGVECQDCHLPYATKSAQALGPHQGDVKTHIWYIDTDPDGNMFSADGKFVNLDSNGKAAVTMDFACQRCHETASLDELGKFAKDFHDSSKQMANVGLTSGLTGTWWDKTRGGEGWVLEFGWVGDNLNLFAAFYTYDSAGNQTWLTAQNTAINGLDVTVNIYITSGAKWGSEFNTSDVELVQWGTGTFTFPTCETATFRMVPSADMVAMGYTEQTFNLTRDLFESGIQCPTFVNNAQ